MRTLIALWLIIGTAVLAQSQTRQSPRKPPDTTAATTGAPVVTETLALQVMLDRAGFSPGEIDGKPGPNLRRALSAYQRTHRVAESAQIDAAGWQRLSEETGGLTPLISYTITNADVSGPFTPTIPADLVEQAKLNALNYRNPLEVVAEKFHASPQLLQQLNPGAAFSAGEQVLVPNVQPFDISAVAPPRRSGEVSAEAGRALSVTIAVTKSTGALTVEDAGGKILFHAPVTSGSDKDPLPIGTWKVTAIQAMPVFNYNPDLFWDANPKHSKARIQKGPNNPVGVAWIDLSKEHYGIHGTPEPSRVGHTQSHGCVRLTNWDVQRLMQWARVGAPVEFRE
jgi:lipoprotein-anchoring transpeptidase ErfK/SrfK